MAARAEKFTGTTQLRTADEAEEIIGLVVVGFTNVVVYDGTDNTGTPVLAGGPGSWLANEPIVCERGIHVECSGVGSGSVLI